MSSHYGRGIPEVWCPLIPLDHMREINASSTELRRINSVYDDWRASMVNSPDSKDIGVALDRIRMLLINIGVACGHNYELAKQIQTLVDAHLKETATRLIDRLPATTPQDRMIKDALTRFFLNMRFIRDIDPTEEIRHVIEEEGVISSSKMSMHGVMFIKTRREQTSSGNRENKREDIYEALREKTAFIAFYLYRQLLSPDPWGDE